VVSIINGKILTENSIESKKDIVLITDCMRLGGLSFEDYDLSGQAVVVYENSVPLIDGTVAGSILKLMIQKEVLWKIKMQIY
jgi:N-acetylglucosamine-6-phosphate deacetylase